MTSLKSALAALAMLTAAAMFGGQASAQTTDNRDLGVQVAHEMFGAMNMADLIREGAKTNTAALSAFDKIRPEWGPMMIDALEAAVVKDTPAIEASFGAHFAKIMSRDELTAALVVFRDPQARAMIAAYAHHQPPAGDPSRPCAGECMRAIASPAGRGFMTKLQSAFGPEMQSEMMATIVPDMFIIFGERARAAEAKRAAP